jgi:hypothetical protein
VELVLSDTIYIRIFRVRTHEGIYIEHIYYVLDNSKVKGKSVKKLHTWFVTADQVFLR